MARHPKETGRVGGNTRIGAAAAQSRGRVSGPCVAWVTWAGRRETVPATASAGARRYRLLEDRGADGPRAPWRRSRRRDQAGDPKSLSISSEWWSSRSATLRLDQPPDVTEIVVPAVRGASSRLLGRTGLPPAPPHRRVGGRRRQRGRAAAGWQAAGTPKSAATGRTRSAPGRASRGAVVFPLPARQHLHPAHRPA